MREGRFGLPPDLRGLELIGVAGVVALMDADDL
jgi:hypothetical protein